MVIILKTISKFLYALEILIIVRVVISWLPVNRDNKLVDIIYTITEPILYPIRKLIDKSIFGGKGQVFDLSPLIAYIILQLLQSYLP